MKEKLNEESSINFQCQELANEIVDYFVEIIDKKDPVFSFDEKGFPTCKLQWKPKKGRKIFNGMLSLVICEVGIISKYKYARYNTQAYFSFAFYMDGFNTICFRMPIVEDKDGTQEIKSETCKDLLSHELLHAYQTQFKVLKNSRSDQLYVNATKVMSMDVEGMLNMLEINSENDAWDRWILEHVVDFANALYYFSSMEINANANTLYSELKRNNVQTKEEAFKTETYSEFRGRRYAAMNALSDISPNWNQIYQSKEWDDEHTDDAAIVRAAESWLGVPYKKIKSYILYGIKVCETKFAKVVSYYLSRKDEKEQLLRETTINPHVLNEEEDFIVPHIIELL